MTVDKLAREMNTLVLKNAHQKTKIKDKIKQLKDWFQSQLLSELMKIKFGADCGNEVFEKTIKSARRKHADEFLDTGDMAEKIESVLKQIATI